MRKFLTRWWYCADWQQTRTDQAIQQFTGVHIGIHMKAALRAQAAYLDYGVVYPEEPK